MNISKITYGIVWALLMTALVSCTEEIDLNLNDTYPRLVVEGSITTDTVVQKIKLSKSTSYFYNEPAPVISGAAIEMTDGSQKWAFTEDPAQPGTYLSPAPLAGIPGKSYSITISKVDIDNDGQWETYHAKDTMKNILTVDSIYAVKDEFRGKSGYFVYGYAQEPPTPHDFYMFRYYINGQLITDTLKEMTFQNDAMVNGNYLSNIRLGFITGVSPGDTLTMETNSVSYGYYLFVITFMIETTWNSSGFGGPPANIKTNIDPGGLGYFNTAARSRISTILP